MCKGKQRFKTELDAMLARANWKKGHTRVKEVKRQYLCPKCKGWHLTSKEARA
jgi:hypothetical protein